MKQGLYDDAVVKEESGPGCVQEVGITSGREKRLVSPLMKRRDGGSGLHGRSAIDREFAKGGEDERLRDSAVSVQRTAIERELDGKDESSKARGSKEVATSCMAVENGTQHCIGRLGTESGSSQSAGPSEEDWKNEGERDSFVQSSSVENDNEGCKALVEKKKDSLSREEDEAVVLDMKTGSDVGSEREEGELNPVVEVLPDNDHKHEEAHELEADKTKESECERAVGLRDEPMIAAEAVAPALVNMNFSETETGVQIIRSSEQHATEEVDGQEVIEQSQWDPKFPVEHEHIEIEPKQLLKEGNLERPRRVSVQVRNLELVSSIEEYPSRQENSDQVAANSAGIFFMRLSGGGRDREEVKGEERRIEKRQRVGDGANLSLALPETSPALSSGDPCCRPHMQRGAPLRPSQQAPTQTHSRGALGSERVRGQGRERGYESFHNPHGSHQVSLTDREIHAATAHDASHAMQRELKRNNRYGEADEVWFSPSRSGDSREALPHSKGERITLGQREKETAAIDREHISIGMQDIVQEAIPSMSRKLQELPDSFLAGMKKSLRDMFNSIEK
uniref:Uncharacterized protein n=1 Tax=Physcomitrium patens TaxID=3218 RepID=A0A2K1IB24_PHYPA|nr:hypothetical protein PHYPA_031043 [Physcomitrium patens]